MGLCLFLNPINGILVGLLEVAKINMCVQSVMIKKSNVLYLEFGTKITVNLKALFHLALLESSVPLSSEVDNWLKVVLITNNQISPLLQIKCNTIIQKKHSHHHF